MKRDVTVSPRFSVTERKSAAVSPTVVAIIFIVQKASVTSGTLLSIARSRLVSIAMVQAYSVAPAGCLLIRPWREPLQEKMPT
jgi:hypothetical protein